MDAYFSIVRCDWLDFSIIYYDWSISFLRFVLIGQSFKVLQCTWVANHTDLFAQVSRRAYHALPSGYIYFFIIHRLPFPSDSFIFRAEQDGIYHESLSALCLPQA